MSLSISAYYEKRESQFWEQILNFRQVFGVTGLSTRVAVSDKLNAMFSGQRDINMNCIFDDLRVNGVDILKSLLFSIV